MESHDFHGNVSNLSTILDRIDSTNVRPRKMKRLDDSATGNIAVVKDVCDEAKFAQVDYASLPKEDPVSDHKIENTHIVQNPLQWLEYHDHRSKKNYYYNVETKETTWERPDEFVSIPVTSVPTNNIAATSISEEYRFTGAFSAQNGQFTTLKSHLFNETGQPIDKSVRQLSHYMDVNELQQNREEAKRKRNLQLTTNQPVNWKEYNQQKKDDKKRKRMESLLNSSS